MACRDGQNISEKRKKTRMTNATRNNLLQHVACGRVVCSSAHALCCCGFCIDQCACLWESAREPVRCRDRCNYYTRRGVMATPLLLCIQISVILFSECEWRPRSVINQCHHPMVLLVDCAACSILAFSGRYGQHTYDTNTRNTHVVMRIMRSTFLDFRSKPK